MPSSDLFFFNGINGATGEYLLPPLTAAQLCNFAIHVPPVDREYRRELDYWHRYKSRSYLGVPEGLDPDDLSQAGWGVVFPAGAKGTAAVREALAPLLSHRQQRVGANYKELEYRPGESKTDFLARYGAGPGPADPEHVPYYLLIIGSPAEIPFGFQSQIDLQYAVGRLWFDTPDQYARYAESVVVAEEGRVLLPRQATIFAPRHSDDVATELSTTRLAAPLAEELAGWRDWKIRTVFGGDATGQKLARLLGGDSTPALLLTIGHALGFPQGNPLQVPQQGALLCADWPGPSLWQQAIPRDFYFAAEDLAADARLLGLVTFHIASYGGGTPALSDFPLQEQTHPVAMSKRPFVARLPQRLLSHPKGGALAAIAQVDLSWGISSQRQDSDAGMAVYSSVLRSLMNGSTVGVAMGYLGERYAELSVELTSRLEDIQFGARYDETELAELWTAVNDSQSFLILGDPAVRLAVGGGPARV